MAQNEIVFYDIAGRGGCWSPNTWKTRLVLNYKQLPYRTEWLEMPDIAPTLSSLGVPKNSQGAWADYTCPTIRLSDGEYISDSMEIAKRLESLHPEASLHLDTKEHEAVFQALMKLLSTSIRPTIILAAQRNILHERSAVWHAKDREKRFGKSLEEIEKEEGGENAWGAARPGLEELKTQLQTHKRDAGPFVLGSVVSYGDFVIAGFFEWVRRADGRLYERMLDFHVGFKEHHRACQPWLARDDRVD